MGGEPRQPLTGGRPRPILIPSMDNKRLIIRLKEMASELTELVSLAKVRMEKREEQRRKALLRRGNGAIPLNPDDAEINLELLSTLASHSLSALKNAIIFEETRQQVVADDLTKLYNYRYFNRRLVEEWKRAIRHRFALGLIMADVDNFKRVNDTRGHAAGNAILMKIAEVIKSTVREIDIVARYGGDEFAVILPQTPPSQLKLVAARVRRNLSHLYANRGRPMRVTLSFGIAGWPGDAKSPGALLKRADAALLRAKRTGKNRIVSA